MFRITFSSFCACHFILLFGFVVNPFYFHSFAHISRKRRVWLQGRFACQYAFYRMIFVYFFEHLLIIRVHIGCVDMTLAFQNHQLCQCVVSLSKTLYPHCLCRLSWLFGTGRGHPRLACLLSAVSSPEELALKIKAFLYCFCQGIFVFTKLT